MSFEIDKQPGSAYCALPNDVHEDVEDIGVNRKSKKEKEEFLSKFLEKNVPDERLQAGLEDNLKYKQHFLEKVEKSRKKDGNVRKRKCLSAKERKKLKLFEIKPEEQKYSMYEPLHDLWNSYIKDVMNISRVNKTNIQEAENKLLKADLHGCRLTVTRSKCPSLIGITGILLQESKNVFKVITEDDRLKTLQKANSVFTICVEDLVFTIYGNHFRYRASERAVRKFKPKDTIDL